jgi:DNA-3-methyladenine glycosylase II
MSGMIHLKEVISLTIPTFPTTYTLTPVPPYRFAYFRQRVENSSNRYLYSISDNKLSRAVMIDNQPVLVHVREEASEANPAAPQIHLELQGATTPAMAEQTVNVWRNMLSVDRPLLPFYQQMQEDPIMRGIIENLYGLHLLVESGPFEAMIQSIVGQQVNLTFAENLKRALVELCGQKIKVDGEAHFAFPSPEAVARLNYEDLRPLKYSQRKAEYVIDFARAVASGTYDLTTLNTMSNEEAIESMVKLRGIGRWTAECVLLFGLGRPDLLPAADIGLRNAIQLFYGLKEQPSEALVREFAQPWRGYESYATYYLWAALGIARAEQKLSKDKSRQKASKK